MAEACGADAVMLHAMFGLAWSETDEEAYLDLFCPKYAVTRYLRLRRFSPFASDYVPPVEADLFCGDTYAPATHKIRLENNTDQPQAFYIAADFAVNGNWSYHEL